MRDDATPPTICESCGCEVYAAGHPGNMCRTIRSLRAECDALAAELARVMPVVEEALVYCSPKSIAVMGLARACDAYRATTSPPFVVVTPDPDHEPQEWEGETIHE